MIITLCCFSSCPHLQSIDHTQSLNSMEQNRIALKLQPRKLISSTLVLMFVTFLLNYLLREHLYNHSIVLAIRMQRIETVVSTSVFNFLLILADPRLVGFIFVVSNIVCKNKDYVLAHLMYFLGWIWVSIVLKSLYADPRPFWSSSSVLNLSDTCHYDYGNPSGSAITPILLFEPLIIHFVGLGKYCLHLLLPVLLGISIPIGSIYLGIVSVNQVLLGVILNLTALLLWKLYFADLLTTFLLQLTNYTKKGKAMMIWMFFLHIFIVLVPLMIYLYRPRPMLLRPILINIATHCEVVPSTLKEVNFQMLMLCTFVNVCFGYCYGNYMDAKFNRSETKRWSLPDSFWWLKFVIDTFLMTMPAFIVTHIHQHYQLSSSSTVYLLVCLTYTIVGYIQIRWSPLLRSPEPSNPLAFESG